MRRFAIRYSTPAAARRRGAWAQDPHTPAVAALCYRTLNVSNRIPYQYVRQGANPQVHLRQNPRYFPCNP